MSKKDPNDIVRDLAPDMDQLLIELGKSIIDIADYLVDRIRMNTPVDTGRLRNSVIWSKLSTQGQTHMTVEVGSNVVYAPHVEFGTSRMEAARMFRTGIELTHPWATKRIERALAITS